MPSATWTTSRVSMTSTTSSGSVLITCRSIDSSFEPQLLKNVFRWSILSSSVCRLGTVLQYFDNLLLGQLSVQCSSCLFDCAGGFAFEDKVDELFAEAEADTSRALSRSQASTFGCTEVAARESCSMCSQHCSPAAQLAKLYLQTYPNGCVLLYFK